MTSRLGLLIGTCLLWALLVTPTDARREEKKDQKASAVMFGGTPARNLAAS